MQPGRRQVLAGFALAGGLLIYGEVMAVAPLNRTQEFMYGPFRMPDGPPHEGSLPERLVKLPRDRSPLGDKIWLRFQMFGGSAHPGHAAQMQLSDEGNIFLVAQLGTATAASVEHPAWSTRPCQLLDAAVLARLHEESKQLPAQAFYRGHEGLPYAPTFVITIKHTTGEREVVYEAYEDDFVRHLRRIAHFALTSPLSGTAQNTDKGKKAGNAR